MKESYKKIFNIIFGEPHFKPVSMIKLMLPLRGFAIFFVVLAHSSIGMLAADVSLSGERILSTLSIGPWRIASFWNSMILELCRFAVPLFLFLAGYSLLSMPRTWKAVWSTSRKLIVPMVFWSFVGLAFSWRKGTGGWQAQEFLWRLVTGNTQLGYFFMILIVQYYVLSMWLIPAMEKKPCLILAYAVGLQLAVHAYDYLYLLSTIRLIVPIPWIVRAGPFPEYLFPRFIISFALGIWAAQPQQRFKGIVIQRFPAIVGLAGTAALLLALERGLLYYYGRARLEMNPFEATALSWVEWKGSTMLWTIGAVFLLFGLFQKRIPMKKFLEYLGKNAFYIFLLHGMVLNVTKMALYKFFEGYHFYGFFGTAISLAAGIAIPLLMTNVIQRVLPASFRTLLLG